VNEPQPDSLSLIDQAVSRFRRDWRAGKRPKIEECLAACPQLSRPDLFKAFLAAEVHERGMLGESPTPDEYRARYQQFAAEVGEAFDDTQNSLVDSSMRQSPGGSHGPPAKLADADGGESATLDSRYSIIKRLGSGGFGTVYEAWDRQLDRTVALKTPRLGILGSEADAQRFLREARAAGQLRHPNIVPVYDAGKVGNSYFIASGLIEGQTLADRLAKERLSAHDAATLIEKLALALHYAHTKGIIHRDIKPANVMIDSTGEPLVMDFGMARRDEGEELRTQPGMLIGTPAYMSPEQHAGQSHLADARSDQWALGVMLYEMLTGRRPFEASSILEISDAVREKEPDGPSRLDKRISRDLETICLKCVQKEPENRYASCQHLAEDLGRWLRGEPIAARPVKRIERAWRWCQRNPVIAGLSLAATVLLLAVAVVAGIGYLLTARALHRETAAREASESERQGKQKALTREIAERQRAEEEEQQAKRNFYLSKITSARSKWLACDLEVAERELDACPRELRHWEWGYLKRLCHLELATVKLDFGEVGHLALSPDGKRIAVTAKEGSRKITVCDAGTGTCIGRLQERDLVSRMAFSPDGKQIVSLSRDKTVKIWDVATGKVTVTFRGHPGGAGIAAFSPGGKQVASGGAKAVKIWAASTGEEIRTLDADGSASVAFSPDGKRLAAGAGDTVRVWNVETGTELATLRGKRLDVHCVALGPKGDRIAAGSGKLYSVGLSVGGENVVKVWEIATGKEVAALHEHGKGVTAVAFSPDGSRLATGSMDRTLRIWDLSTGEELTTLRGHSGTIVGIVYSSDGARVTSASDDGTVKTWEVSNKEALSLYRKKFTFASAVFSRDGQLFAVKSLEALKICDAATGREKISIPVGSTNRAGLAFMPDGQQIVSGGVRGMMRWNTTTGKKEGEFSGEGGFTSGVAMTADGKYLASGSIKGTVSLWNAATGQKEFTFAERSKCVWSVAISPDGKRVAAGSTGTVRIWDCTTRKQVCAIKRGESFGVAFSPDGKRLAAGVEKAVELFDGFTGEEVATFRGHDKAVSSVAFSSDGKRIVSGSFDGAIKIWDADTGQDVMTFVHRKGVVAVAFSPDGKRILSASSGDGVKLWEAAEWKTP
jgi:eukaryotic-like serine/threonine-protein kinase